MGNYMAMQEIPTIVTIWYGMNGRTIIRNIDIKKHLYLRNILIIKNGTEKIRYHT